MFSTLCANGSQLPYTSCGHSQMSALGAKRMSCLHVSQQVTFLSETLLTIEQHCVHQHYCLTNEPQE